MSRIALIINGKQVFVPSGATVLEACQQEGFFVPTFCYQKDLTAPGACRICIVEIKGWRNFSPACVTYAAEGMEIETESPSVIEARKTILELLVANHPLDCMTCEKSGDCRLQEYAYRYGVKSPTRFEGGKKSYSIDDTNPYIYRDQNKCILCGKCIAACAAVEGRRVIDFAGRGFNTKVASFMDREFKDSSCVYCGRCVAVCPVGAIMDKTMMGKGRVWEIEKKEVTCSMCEHGCKFDLNIRNGQTIGATPKVSGKGRPLCLKGRLAVKLTHSDGLIERPMIKKNGEFVEVSWDEALGITQLTRRIREIEAKVE